MRVRFLFALIISLASLNSALAQTTEFTYRGRLDDGGVPAYGLYDFEFRLFDVETGGSALAVQQRFGVSVSGGSYTVRLDFGNNFPGAARFLEVAYKSAPGPFIAISPRETVNYSPYTTRSASAGMADQLTASCNGCVQNSHIEAISGGKVSGEIPVVSVPAGSASYIQNATSQQAASNFNISGNGTAGGMLSANAINTATQYNIGGSRVLSTPALNNTFLGFSAGAANTAGVENSLFGRSAGAANTTGSGNSFFGRSAGNSNTTGARNSFFGRFAGNANVAGNDNAFFGYDAGAANTAINNSFFGAFAGNSNTSGVNNAFFGTEAGTANTTACCNAFFAYRAGFSNTTGFGNSFFGNFAGATNTTANNNSFFGNNAGISNQTGADNSFFGSSTGGSNTTGSGNTFFGRRAGERNTTGNRNTVIGNNADVESGDLMFATAIGANAVVSTSETIQLGRRAGRDTVYVPGKLTLDSLGIAGSTDVCRNVLNQLSHCSSSLRYKLDVSPLADGSSLVRQLRPITFRWTADRSLDVGLVAEEVARVAPLLVTRNRQGEIEGVKYSKLSVILVNAVREQEARIAELQHTIEHQQQQLRQLDDLKRLVCQSHPNAEVCKQERR